MQADVFKRDQRNQIYVHKACKKTKFPVATEIETKAKTIPNHNERLRF